VARQVFMLSAPRPITKLEDHPFPSIPDR